MTLASRAQACLFVLLITGAAACAQPGGPLRPSPAPAPAPGTALARIPLYFVENRGQAHGSVRYYTLGSDAGVYFDRSGITFSLAGPAPDSPAGGPRSLAGFATMGSEASRAPRPRWALKVDFVRANPAVRIEGLDRTECTFNYFRGQPDEWNTGVPSFSSVRYRDLWPGIDLVYRGDGPSLKYGFVVRPGADPSAIRMQVRGGSAVVDDQGRLRIENPVRPLVDEAPIAYTADGNARALVDAAYRVERVPGARDGLSVGDRQTFVSFEVGEFDRSRTLVIDPTIFLYCGYIGGTGSESAAGVAVDNSGSAYVCGSTESSPGQGFPALAGPDTSQNGSVDVFVAKVKPDGTGLLYCGYIGGSDLELGASVAVDRPGYAYVCGTTRSSQGQGFPVQAGPDLTFNGTPGVTDNAFVARVLPTGTGLAYCGYIGGGDLTNAQGIAVDTKGSAYVCGGTLASQNNGFPLLGGPSLTHSGDVDAFVAKVKSDGSTLLYCGCIGGSELDVASGIAVDQNENAYVCGATNSTPANGFPTVSGPSLTYNGGNQHAWVAKIAAPVTGVSLAYCGYLGGSDIDAANAIAVDEQHAAYVCGYTRSSEAEGCPVAVGPDLTFNSQLGNTDAFVLKVAPSGTSLDYCGYIGGRDGYGTPGGSWYGIDEAHGIAIDSQHNAYVCGETTSNQASAFPVTSGPDLTFNENFDAFIAKVKPSGASLTYCTYLGGYGSESAHGIAVDDSGDAYVAGLVNSSPSLGFPVLVGPSLNFGGYLDAFVAKITSPAVAPPTGVLVTLVTHTFIELHWSDDFHAGGGYHVDRRSGDSPYTGVTTVNPGTVSFRDSDVEPGVTYTYRVQALDAAGVSPYSNEATATVPEAAGVLSVSPVTVSFGSAKGGAPRSRTLKLKNRGAGPLFVSVGELTAPFSAAPSGDRVIAPKKSLNITVTFTPATRGSFQQTLVITSDDPGHPSTSVPVSGARK